MSDMTLTYWLSGVAYPITVEDAAVPERDDDLLIVRTADGKTVTTIKIEALVAWQVSGDEAVVDDWLPVVRGFSG